MSKAVDQAEKLTVATQTKNVLTSPKPTVKKGYPVCTPKPNILEGFVYGSSINVKTSLLDVQVVLCVGAQ